MNILLHKRTFFIMLLLPQLLFSSENPSKGSASTMIQNYNNTVVEVNLQVSTVPTGQAASQGASHPRTPESVQTSKRLNCCTALSGLLLFGAWTAACIEYGRGSCSC